MRGPTLKVSIGFGSTWTTADGSITWTDVTAKVFTEHGVTVSRGRGSELDEFRTGTCSLVLDNRGRLFDPSHSAGTHYGQLLPGVPLKIEGIANSTTYPVFRGFIDGWPQDFELSDNRPVVRVTATDGFAKLAKAGTPSSVYALEVAADEPVAWWRLSESAGDVMGDASGNRRDGTYTTGASLLAGRHPNQWETISAIDFDREHSATVVENIITAYPFTAEWIVKFDDVFTWTSGDYSAVIEGGDGTYGYSLAVNAYGAGPGGSDDPDMFYTMFTALGGLAYSTSAETGVAGDARVAHHMALRALSTGIYFYIDGELVASDTTSFAFGLAVSGTHIAGSPLYSYVHTLDGQLGDVALYDSDLGTTRLGVHYEAFRAPWDGDTTGERIDRILTAAGWPSSLIDTATGLTVLGPAVIGKNALALLKTYERSEQGRLFISRAGKVTFLDRYYNLTVTEGTTAQATFSDDGADIPYSGLGFDYDARVVYNRVRGSRPGGSTVEVYDQTSIDTYGEQVDDSLNGIEVGTDAELRALLELRLDRYKDPLLRARPLTIDLHGRTNAQQATVLALELGYRVNIERTPNDTGSAIDQDTIIEGIAHRIGPGSWTTTITTSPVDTRAYALWDAGLWDSALWAA